MLSTLKSSRGLTLMEVLVAFTVGVMVLSIIVSALRVSVGAWDRMKGESERAFSSVMQILDLMERQLCYPDFKTASVSLPGWPLVEAKSNKLVFASRLSPMGVSRNNPVMVVYSFDPESRLFSYRQKLLSDFDSEDEIEAFIRESDREEEIGTTISIADVRFGYRGSEDLTFRDEWEDERELPEEIKISLWLEREERPVVWIMKVAPFGKGISGAEPGRGRSK